MATEVAAATTAGAASVERQASWHAPSKVWRPMTNHHRHFIVPHNSKLLGLWNISICAWTLWHCVYATSAVVFPELRFSGFGAVEVVADLALLLDLVVRLRTSFMEHGYEVTKARPMAMRYLRGCHDEPQGPAGA